MHDKMAFTYCYKSDKIMEDLVIKMKVVHKQQITEYIYSGNCPNCGEVITDQDTVKLDYKGFCPECKKPIHIMSE